MCTRLCVVHKLPTDKSPREVLEQVCLGLVWERVGWKCARSRVSVCVGFGLHMLEGKQSRLFLTAKDLISIYPDGQHHHS